MFTPVRQLIEIDPIEDVTRRRFLSSAMAAALVIACGDSDEEEAESTPEATTRIVDTEKGPIEVPVRPERVVVFDRRGTLAYMLDMGIKPIAAFSAPDIYGGSAFHPLINADVADIAKIDATEPDLEQVAALNPDLIFGNFGDVDQVWDQLTAIAPTIAYTIDYNNPEDELLMIGKVFGTEDKAKGLIKAFEDEIAAARASLKNPGSVSLVLPTASNIRVYNGDNLAGQIVTGLGGRVTPDIQPLGPAASGQHANVSFEQASVIDGDTIVLFANLGSEWMSSKNALLSMPVFQTLPAVKNNRVIEVESQANFGTAGLRGQRQILEVLKKAFA